MKQVEIWIAVNDGVDIKEFESRLDDALADACCGDYDDDTRHRSPNWAMKISEMSDD